MTCALFLGVRTRSLKQNVRAIGEQIRGRTGALRSQTTDQEDEISDLWTLFFGRRQTPPCYTTAVC